MDQIKKPLMRAIKDDGIDPRVSTVILGTTLYKTIMDGGSRVNVLPESSWIDSGKLRESQNYFS